MTIGRTDRTEYAGEGTSLRAVTGSRVTEVESHSGLYATLNVLLRYRRTIVACIAIMAVALIGMALSAPRTYTSGSSFMPHVSGGSLAGLSNLAAQLGVNVGKEDPTQSPDFYAEVIKSHDLLATLAASQFTVQMPDGPARGILADVLKLEPALPAVRLEDALKHLQRMIFVNVTRQTGIMHVQVTTPSADLSQQLSERLLKTLDEFNTRLRKNQASAEEKFLEEREQEARASHDAAEERVVDFLRRNGSYKAPALEYEYSRLRQEAMYRADVVATLTKGRAQARIEAARNTPVITVLDQPSRAIRPDGRGLVRAGLLAIVLGAMVGVTLAFMANAMRQKDEDEQKRQFDTLRAQALADLRHPLRALVPWRQPGTPGNAQ
ncbi:MAG: lipopolysaccharide biosynthesis protein [Gemmatimonadetes bacterium]|nr:lipopolysaccharide biosynthesis protein [Gemmatimonadota bacterium]